MNDRPEGHGLSVQTDIDEELEGQLSADDPDNTAAELTFALVTAARNGAVTVDENGAYTYTPKEGFTGKDVFTYSVTDPSGLTTNAEVSVNVGTAAPGGPMQINTTARPGAGGNGDLQEPSVAMSAGGGVAVWGTGPESTSDIYVRALDSNGAPTGSETRLNTATTGRQLASHVIALSGGGYLAAWTSQRQLPAVYEGRNYGTFNTITVRARRLSVAGVPSGPEFTLHPESYIVRDAGSLRLIHRRAPKLAALSDGGFVAVWRQNLNGVDDYELYAQRYDAAGSAKGAEFLIHAEDRSSYQANPDVTELSNGNILFTWMEYGTNNAPNFQEVHGRLFNAAGAPLGAQFRVNQSLPWGQRDPAVAALPNGEFFITWADGGSVPWPGRGWDITGRRYNASGNPVGKEIRINNLNSKGLNFIDGEGRSFNLNVLGSQTEPSIAVMGNGDIVVVWESENQQFIPQRGIVVQRFNINGEAVDNSFMAVNLPFVEDWRPTVTALPGEDGAFIVTWQTSDRAGGNTGVYTRIFRPVHTGTADADRQIGSDMSETFNALAGDDVIEGGGGDDTILGGAGADRLDGGGGTDTVDYSDSAESIVLNLRTETGQGGDAEGDTYKDVERFIGTKHDDVFITSSGVKTFTGGGGTDTVILSGAAQDYTVTRVGGKDDVLRISSGPQTVTLSSIERIQFADVTFNIDGLNLLPSVKEDRFSAVEDTPLSIPTADLLVNDADLDGSLTIVSVESAAGGEVSLDGSGNVIFTPDADFTGAARFTYTVEDSSGARRSASARVDVGAVNDAPVTAPDVLSTNEDTPLSVFVSDILDNDSDVDGDTVTLMSVSAAVGGSVRFENGVITFTPDENFNGDASFEYAVSDGAGGEASGTVSVDVVPVNDAPAPQADVFSLNEDMPLTVSAAELLANDQDAEDDALTVISAAAVRGGSVSLENGVIIFTPDADFNGEASFEYTVSDGNGGEAVQTAVVNVAPANDAPAPQADAFSTNEDMPLTVSAAALLANDSDVDGDELTVTSVGGAVDGAVSLENGVITFTPDADFSGKASFEYTVSDGAGGEVTETVDVDVAPVNDAPDPQEDSGYSVTEDGSLNINAADLLANDSDTEGHALTVKAVGNGVGGAAVLVNGVITFTPEPEFTGPATFEYTVLDAEGGESVSTVRVNVLSGNDAPTAQDDYFTAWEDGRLVISPEDLLFNDFDPDIGDVLSVASVSVDSTGSGRARIDAKGRIIYTPDPDFNGETTFTYTIRDGDGAESSASAVVQVLSLNDAPEAAADSAAGDEDTTVTLDVLSNDNDIDVGDVLRVTGARVLGGPGKGGVTVNPDGTLAFTPGAALQRLREGETGRAKIEYTVSDGRGGADKAVATVTVTGVNDAPEALTPQVRIRDEDTPVSGVLAAHDAEGDDVTFTLIEGPAKGRLTLDADGAYRFDPEGAFNALAKGETEEVTFTYTMSDGQGGVTEAEAALKITGVNDRPVAADDAAATDEDTVIRLDVLANDADADASDILRVTKARVVGADKGRVTVNSDNTLSFIPGDAFQSLGEGETAEVEIAYRINDGQGGRDTAVATVTVTGVNDAPEVLTPPPLSTDEDAPVSGMLEARDAEGDELTFSIVSGPAKGRLALNADGAYTFDPAGAFNALAADQTEDVTFTYSVSDGQGGVTETSATVTVTGANDAPSAGDDNMGQISPYGHPLVITLDRLLANDSDPDSGDTLSIVSVGNEVSGKAVLRSGGQAVYFQQQYYTTGTASFEYTVSDGAGGFSTTTVSFDMVRPQQNIRLGLGRGDPRLWGGGADDILDGRHGDDRIYGFGGNDSLYGGRGRDTIYGGDGDDYIHGGRGNDLLTGGAGSDTYFFTPASGRDVINNAGGDDASTDKILFGAGIQRGQLWFTKSGDDLHIDVVTGKPDAAVTVRGWFSDAQARVDQIEMSDGGMLDKSGVENLVNAMAGMTPPAAGQTGLSERQKAALAPVLAAAWQTS